MSNFMSLNVEQALLLATVAHAGQARRCSAVPYVEHAFAVAWILDRAGFEEDTVVAGLLHDVVEDTSVTLGEIVSRFGPVVAEMVELCSERKTDAQGGTSRLVRVPRGAPPGHLVLSSNVEPLRRRRPAT